MNGADDEGELLEASDIGAALDRVATSLPFRTSRKLAAFLRFVVERTLAGDSAHIKGYTIATQALGRDASFDPQLDPIVRVAAGRLRRALKQYYEGDGSNDPILINLPRGSYVPVFCRRLPDRWASTVHDGLRSLTIRLTHPRKYGIVGWLLFIFAAVFIIIKHGV